MRAVHIISLFALWFAPLCAEDKPTPTPAPEAKPAAAKDEAKTDAKTANAATAIDWREVLMKDAPLEVKKALISECDKLAGDGEVIGFKCYQASLLDGKEALFKAEFSAGGKLHTITCSPTGEIKSSQSIVDPAVPPVPAK